MNRKILRWIVCRFLGIDLTGYSLNNLVVELFLVKMVIITD